MGTKFLRLLTYFAGFYLSGSYADGPWIAGPAFGFVIVLWESDFFRRFQPLRQLAFIGASTLIYAFVFYIASQNWSPHSDFGEAVYGPLPVAVIVGSTLLPFAQRYVLKASDRIVAQTIPLLIFIYYAVMSVSYANDHWEWGLNVNFLFILVGLWQGAYLYFMFPEKRA